MPAGLPPPQILLLAAPIAMLLSALALSAGERRAKARRAREAIGAPLEAVDAARDGEAVVLEGKLHVLEGPCARFEDGREAAATTVESRRAPSHPSAGLRSILADSARERLTCAGRATAMVLRCGKEDVLIEGPVEVAVGTDEMHPGAPFQALATRVRERIEATCGGAPPDLASEESMQSPVFRSLRDHSLVRAAGRLAKTSDGARTGYRERAMWVLVGTDEAPVTLAYEGTPRHRGATGAVLLGVKRVEIGHVLMSLAIVVSTVIGLAYAIGRPHRHPARPGASQVDVRLRPGADQAAAKGRIKAGCAQPRPAALPAGWRCVGEAESFTMYLPEDVECVEDHGAGCVPQGYAGSQMRIHPHFDASEVELATVERHGTEVEIDGVPARVLRSHHAITLLFEEDGTGVPPRLAPGVQTPRLSFDVQCDSDEACRHAWLALQTIRLW